MGDPANQLHQLHLAQSSELLTVSCPKERKAQFLTEVREERDNSEQNSTSICLDPEVHGRGKRPGRCGCLSQGEELTYGYCILQVLLSSRNGCARTAAEARAGRGEDRRGAERSSFKERTQAASVTES